MAVYGYARVSTVRQADEGESLAVQERQIAGYATMLGLPAPQMCVERGVSGSVALGARLEGAALLTAMKRGDVVITAKLDRMFRSALDALDILERFKRAGAALHMIDLGGDVTSNGISKLVFTILSAVAEAERDRIRERVAAVKADQKQRGRYLGGKVPFGWRVGCGGGLEPIPAEQEALAMARSLRRDGKTLRAIRDAALERHGIALSISGLHGILGEQSIECHEK